jgi:hypothetical protein
VFIPTPEEPAGENPPDGAINNYYLKQKSNTPVVLEITDAAGKLVRRFSSDDKPLDVDVNKLRHPTYWVRPPQILKNEPGMQRFTWDLMYPNPPSDSYELPISAIYKDTPFVPQGPAVPPGKYTIKLTSGGRTQTQTLTVRMDPRVTTPAAGLNQQFALSMRTYNGIIAVSELLDEVTGLREGLDYARKNAGTNTALIAEIDALDIKLVRLVNGPPPKPAVPVAVTDFALGRINSGLNTLLDVLQDADVAPSVQAAAASADLQAALLKANKSWGTIRDTDLPPLNTKLAAANITPIRIGVHRGDR